MMLLVKDDGRSVAAVANAERVAASRFSVRVMRMANMVSFVCSLMMVMGGVLFPLVELCFPPYPLSTFKDFYHFSSLI